MAIKFQYNKTSLQTLEKQLKVRTRALPTIKSKESALRMEVKKTKDTFAELEEALERQIKQYDHIAGLWNEFDPNLIEVKDIHITTKKIAGVLLPIYESIVFDEKAYSHFNSPIWFPDGVNLLKQLAETGIRAELEQIKLEKLEHARKKTTQKVNLFEKVQIPGYSDAIRKIKRYLEDEESLSKSSQKIMRTNLEKMQRKEDEV
ncbi:V-type ATP synthase subunit D [Bacteroidales bacterium OttesenSCG-928-B11]|nr:V-type ATP synthase subunit D [Bacteroidales bacterium OttesenSCG-928-E04]MDL2308182.1 V-type ATP synthase subunit D [Bacteroidales bacterium OttesenSCG-928-C03]MDL2312976.1 V-type ATP synthase subunit D [Bacteroidales bacterium OttesenSCG-928-B11]MDL2325621.1 V-type ATP synthase subunit D [Bacteroidales bacterium OttesenSCG-928-A14]